MMFGTSGRSPDINQQSQGYSSDQLILCVYVCVCVCVSDIVSNIQWIYVQCGYDQKLFRDMGDITH